MRRLESAKSEKNKEFYHLLSQALIDFDPPRHFAISTKKRRFTGNTEGQLFLPTPVSGPNPARSLAATVMERAIKTEYRKSQKASEQSYNFDCE